MYCISGNVADPRTLLAVNAEHAATAVLLLPWVRLAGQGGTQDDPWPTDIADMADAHVMAAASTLHTLNPGMQVGTS